MRLTAPAPLLALVLLLSAAPAALGDRPADPEPSGTPGAEPAAAPAAEGEPAATPAPEVRYTVLSAGNPAGFQVTRAGDAGIDYAFEYNDRGRGPHQETHLELDAAGLPVSLHTTGHDYLKVPVDERFRREGGKASWRSTAESGETADAGGAFYLPLAGPPEVLAVLAQALLRAEGGELPLLPAGRAGLTRVGERTVRAGEQERTVVLYAVSSLAFTPLPVWLERDGTFFAAGDDWFATVREGWEESLPTLVAAQQEAETARYARWALEVAERPDGPLAITGARLFDAGSAAMLPGRTVVVTGNRITAVGPDGEVEIPAGARRIDAGGKALLPGLWDMHAHVNDLDGLLNLAAGVTSVRDLANDIDKVATLRRQWDSGETAGPRLLAAGFMDGPGPYAGPTKVLVDSAAEARSAIDRYAEIGYRQIKVYSSIRPELVAGIVEHAHARGMRVSGHIPAFMTAERAVELGFDEIQHVNMLFLNFWPDQVPDTRTPARFTEVARRAAELDLASPPVKRFIALLKEKGVVVDPTVSVFETLFLARPGEVPPGAGEVYPRMPPQVRRAFLTGGLPVPGGMEGRYHESFRALLAMVAALHDAGVTLVAGTDGLPGFTLQRELELYAEAGIPPGEVLRIATLGAARVAGRADELGSIEPGKLADLILVDGDPTRDVGDLRHVVLTVKDGVFYRPEEIYPLIGVTP